jgi:hypothetical protein
MAENSHATKAELQEDAAIWVWNQLKSGAEPAIQSGSLFNAPDWSDFDAITPDGNRVKIRIELTS